MTGSGFIGATVGAQGLVGTPGMIPGSWHVFGPPIRSREGCLAVQGDLGNNSLKKGDREQTLKQQWDSSSIENFLDRQILKMGTSDAHF
jgi:hypothetical protein